MKYKILFLAGLLLALSSPVHALGDKLLFGAPREAQIAVNNRIVANVNGKVISVMDVMKKMDMIFYREYPQFADSSEARCQYYQINWKGFLNNLIDQELIIADAEENKLPLSNGDIRQELEETFGPNIHSNLEKAGLTYEEAWDMIKGDLLLKRMMYVRVNSKVMKKITPYVVRSYYEEWAKANTAPPQWAYHMITVRAEDSRDSAVTANHAHYLLTEKEIPLDQLVDALNQDHMIDKGTTVSVSAELRQKEQEVSPQNREIICRLGCDQVSQPVAQTSRRDNKVVFRMYYVKDFDPGGVAPYKEIAPKLKNVLLDKELTVESDIYLNKLRRHHNITEDSMKEYTPEDFEPFVLR